MYDRGLSLQWNAPDGVITMPPDEKTSLIGEHEDRFQGLRPTGRFCGAVIDDYSRRSMVYLSDFTDGLHPKTLSSFLFMFFATFASTVALGVNVADNTTGTNKCMGVTELVLSLSIAGMMHSLVAGCPMAVLRPTGPITLFVIKLYGLAEVLKVDFFKWFAWVGFWVGVYMILIAAFDLCRHIRQASRFLHDMFAFFVCTIYIHDGVSGVFRLWPDPGSQVGQRSDWQDDNCESVACAYFSFILFACTLFGALLLNAVDSTRLFNEHGRQFIKDYALTIAVFATIALGYRSSGAQDWEHPDSNINYIPHVRLPSKFEPTFNHLPEHNMTNRGWWVGLTVSKSTVLGEFNSPKQTTHVCGSDGEPCGFNGTAIFFAAIAAIPVTFWFYFDQLFSCLLHQIGRGPGGLNLEKGNYYHSSFLWVGIFNIFLPMFGLPFVTASLPHSPQFVRALTIVDKSTGKPKAVVDNRIAPFLMYLLCGLALFIPAPGSGDNDRKLLEIIPKGVIYGILTFVGVAGVLPESGNQFSKRLLLLFSFPSEFPKTERYTAVGLRKMHTYTGLQLTALLICWLINLSSTFGSSSFWKYIGIFFPLWIVALIPIRKRLFPMLLPEADLSNHLDCEDENQLETPLDRYPYPGE